MNATRRTYVPMPTLTESLLARMDAKTQAHESGCWVWTGSNVNGYGTVKVSGSMIRVHRIAFFRGTGVDPKELDVDHMCFNHACLNPAHLRLLTNKQNCENRAGLSKRNKSGFRGVSWYKSMGKWRAVIGHNGTNQHLGYFATAAEAGAAANAARINLFTHNEIDRATSTAKDHCGSDVKKGTNDA